jgi:7-cyano-7-deazaguanine reductase
MTEDLKALGTGNTEYTYDKPDPTLLECFPSPFEHVSGSIKITVPEFTSLCPKTGQPDFATIHITYTPIDRCVESKSLKLYMMSFRNHGEFHEACVNRICEDLVHLLKPESIKVYGDFAPRGGIPFCPTAKWHA